ncbi:helix-turn-helix domain-containing protein [Saccharolobus shibatae]|uniref:Bacterio-opsin activator domain-containing protein n=1 Tax=Saccharolobus shibatae TaxID=2286 RepID=A0A8F5C0I4_9CREN|nr:helix-turn-helix domain-containing protein [Saccharolobus shibatae]QXJ34803.1 Bacterio-opsin activator domain-containing protein [Saccharolobus shibatae]
MEKLLLMDIGLSHANCWTELTSRYSVNIKLLSQNFTDDKFFSSKVLILGKDTKNFIKELKCNENMKIEKLDYLDDACLLEFTYPGQNSISNLFHETNSIVVSHRIFDGIEKWKVIINSSKLPHVQERLQNSGNLISFREMKPKKLEKAINGLTDKNLRLLKFAYVRGLFEFPRRNTLMGLSSELGIKPNTLLYHIRKSENALLEILLEEYYSLL